MNNYYEKSSSFFSNAFITELICINVTFPSIHCIAQDSRNRVEKQELREQVTSEINKIQQDN